MRLSRYFKGPLQGRFACRINGDEHIISLGKDFNYDFHGRIWRIRRRWPQRPTYGQVGRVNRPYKYLVGLFAPVVFLLFCMASVRYLGVFGVAFAIISTRSTRQWRIP
jgi:hypothetical protein